MPRLTTTTTSTTAFLLVVVASIFLSLAAGSRLPVNQDERDVPRPVLPRYLFVDVGELMCLNGTGVPCSGMTQGSFHAWFQFDEAGFVEEYREDSVLYDPTAPKQAVLYNREFSNSTLSTYYILPSESTPSLQCFNLPFGYFQFSRFYLQDAKYVGITEPLGSLSKGKKAYTFEAQWQLNFQPINVTTWVLVDKPDVIYGHHFLTILYMFYHYQEMPNGFISSPFTRPEGLPC